MKRWLLRMCVFLLLGAIVNVAVAIWLARNQPTMNVVPAFPDERYSSWTMVDATLADRDWLESRGWRATAPDDATEYVLQTWTFSDRPGVAYRVVGELSRMHPPPREQSAFQAFAASWTDIRRPAIREVRAGWPVQGLRGRIWNSAPLRETMLGKTDWQPQYVIIEAGQIPFAAAARAYSVWIVPTVPIWPGFAINTVFYAAVLWVLFAGPFVLRRRRRIRRGLCPKCAYDLRGTDANVCPECGATK